MCILGLSKGRWYDPLALWHLWFYILRLLHFYLLIFLWVDKDYGLAFQPFPIGSFKKTGQHTQGNTYSQVKIKRTELTQKEGKVGKENTPIKRSRGITTDPK